MFSSDLFIEPEGMWWFFRLQFNSSLILNQFYPSYLFTVNQEAMKLKERKREGLLAGL